MFSLLAELWKRKKKDTYSRIHECLKFRWVVWVEWNGALRCLDCTSKN